MKKWAQLKSALALYCFLPPWEGCEGKWRRKMAEGGRSGKGNSFSLKLFRNAFFYRPYRSREIKKQLLHLFAFPPHFPDINL